jgi:hypothetical protein
MRFLASAGLQVWGLYHKKYQHCVEFSMQPVFVFNHLICIYRIFRPITRALSIQKRSEIVKNEHARYTFERFPTDNAHIICTKKGIGKYGIMY